MFWGRLNYYFKCFINLVFPKKCIKCKMVLNNLNYDICFYCKNGIPKKFYYDGEVEF